MCYIAPEVEFVVFDKESVFITGSSNCPNDTSFDGSGHPECQNNPGMGQDACSDDNCRDEAW